jgi:hypothetical protein
MKRTPFQLHLSTALALTFVAAILLWLNMRAVQLEGFVGSTSYHGKTYENYVVVQGHGWPLTCAKHFIYSEKAIPPGTYWNTINLSVNMAAALAILILCWAIIEAVTRMRKTSVERTE